jgi:hypothetical protein
LSEEVTGLKAQLKDYNLLIEKIHMSANGVIDPQEMMEQATILKTKNSTERQKVDEIFTQRNQFVMYLYSHI